VDFQKTESVAKALEMDGKEVGGRTVIVVRGLIESIY
jgi:hypothetical protein